MKSPTQIKRLAKSLVVQAKEQGKELSHSDALEFLAKENGSLSWQEYKLAWQNRNSVIFSK